jgi:hypothetical protein
MLSMKRPRPSIEISTPAAAAAASLPAKASAVRRLTARSSAPAAG